MGARMEDYLRFNPSRVEGLPDVTEVSVFSDRLELLSAGDQVVIQLADIAKWPRPRRLRRWLASFGYHPRCLPIGERDWFHAPPDRFIRFFTTPQIVVYMPDEGDTEYGGTVFRRMQDVMLRGGFNTEDLG